MKKINSLLMIFLILVIIWYIKGLGQDTDLSQIDNINSLEDECLEGTCIAQNFFECKEFEKTFRPHENIDMYIKSEIMGKEGSYCIIRQTVVRDETTLDFEGKEMICKIPYQDSSASVEDHCEGTLIDAIKEVSI